MVFCASESSSKSRLQTGPAWTSKFYGAFRAIEMISTPHRTRLAARVLVRLRAHLVEEIGHGPGQQRRGLLPPRDVCTDASDEGRRRLCRNQPVRRVNQHEHAVKL